jgi:hypothetical protein
MVHAATEKTAASRDEERSHHDPRARAKASTGKVCVGSASHLGWGLLLIGVLIVVNAFFVAAEYALVRVRRTRMEALAAQGSTLGVINDLW